MSQNVSSNWFQKLSTDSSFLDKQTNTKSVGSNGSNFQSFLSQQIKKTSSVNTQMKTDNHSSTATEVKPFKRMDTTASKLSIKSPEKTVAKEVSEKSASSTETKNSVQETDNVKDDSQNSKVAKVEEKETTNVTETDQETEKTVELSEVAPELLQMIQALPEEVIAQLPEELQVLLTEVSNKLQGLANLTGDSEGKTDSSMNTAFSVVSEQKDTDAPHINAEVVESLKQLVDQLKAATAVSPEQSSTFEKALNQLNSEVLQTELPKPVLKAENLSEGKVSVQSTENSPEIPVVAGSNTAKSNSETKSDLNSGMPNQNPAVEGKNGKEIQSEIQTETKNNSETTVHNFTAKAEASSIAFGKQEVNTQTVKNVMHTNIMDQIINSPKLQIKQTEQGAMMTLKLNPEVLGNVEIKMEIVKGVLQAEINVENMIVKGAIESNLSDLRNALADKGYQVESLNVSVGHDGGQPQEQPHEQQAKERAISFTAEEMEAINSSYEFETVVNDTRIDYLG